MDHLDLQVLLDPLAVDHPDQQGLLDQLDPLDRLVPSVPQVQQAQVMVLDFLVLLDHLDLLDPQGLLVHQVQQALHLAMVLDLLDLQVQLDHKDHLAHKVNPDRMAQLDHLECKDPKVKQGSMELPDLQALLDHRESKDLLDPKVKQE